ncbi:hypothetical protein D3C76_1446520 [compost metagenome]
MAIPPLFISVPAKIKKGIASSEKLSKPFARRWETVMTAISHGNISSMEATVAIPIEKEIGIPMKTSTKKLPKSISATAFSIISSPEMYS